MIGNFRQVLLEFEDKSGCGRVKQVTVLYCKVADRIYVHSNNRLYKKGVVKVWLYQ